MAMVKKTFQVTILYTVTEDPADYKATLKEERQVWRDCETLNDPGIKVKKFEIVEVK
jgi:hypothetical protein